MIPGIVASAGRVAPQHFEPGHPHALKFDGANDYVNITNSFGVFSGSQSFTLEAWVSVVSDPNHSVGNILSFGGEREVYLQSKSLQSGNPGLQIFDGDGNNFVEHATNKDGDGWFHIAAVYDVENSDVYLYIDGDLSDNMGFLPSIDTRSDNSSIGHRSGFNRNHDGEIADVRIWNAARSQAVIQRDMNLRLTGDEPGLFAYWPIWEGEGDTVYDYSGNENDGTLVGAPTWTTP